jgi:hypothetical protein
MYRYASDRFSTTRRQSPAGSGKCPDRVDDLRGAVDGRRKHLLDGASEERRLEDDHAPRLESVHYFSGLLASHVKGS